MSFQRFGRIVLAVALFGPLLTTFVTAQRFTFFPQVAVGGGWSFDVFINNQGAAQVDDVQIFFFDDSGSPLVVDTEVGPTDGLAFSLGPGETQVIAATSSGGPQAGYALLQFPEDASVRATIILRFVQNNRVTTGVGLPQQFPFIHYSFPAQVDKANRINTGLAVANPALGFIGGGDQGFVVSLIGQDGSLNNTAILSLDEGFHTSLFLDDDRLFPGLDGFLGTAVVSALGPYGLLALRLEQNVLSSVAINAGSIIPPFLLSLSETAEVEPNDDPGSEQALTLPAVVQGTISPAGDLDAFSFAAQAGDVVTIVVEASSAGSELDSYLVLWDPDGQPLAFNDQNGLLRQDDSFIRGVLPEDGTYFITVDDFFFGGGTDYTYRLHVGLSSEGPPVETPLINSITPPSGQRGSMVDVTIAGQNLEGATSLNFDPAEGITVSDLQSTSNQVTAMVDISAMAAPGARQVSVTTPLGTSNSVAFTVTEPGAGPGLDGQWSGTTGQAKAISFTVVNETITALNIAGTIQGVGCSSSFDLGTQFSPGKPITDNSFNFSVSAGSLSYTLSGTFTSSTMASGNLSMNQTTIPGVPGGCAGSASTTWMASKQ